MAKVSIISRPLDPQSFIECKYLNHQLTIADSIIIKLLPLDFKNSIRNPI